MEIIRPRHFKKCEACPRVDERIRYENLYRDPLVFNDDFTAEKIELNCHIEPGPNTQVFMDSWHEGHFTFKGKKLKQRREGTIKKVECPHFEDQ